ncbi:MAG: hypothetical protein ABIP79_10720 [Chitinophagaceae bacterium]
MKIYFVLFLFFATTASAQQLKSISFYLAHPNVSKAAKKFYKNIPLYRKNPGKYYFGNPNIESFVGEVMDSIFTANNDTRPFYLYLHNINGDMADGALLLTVMYDRFNFISSYPARFFQYMIDNPQEKDKYFKKWSASLGDYFNQTCTEDANICSEAFKNKVAELIRNETDSVKLLAEKFLK